MNAVKLIESMDFMMNVSFFFNYLFIFKVNVGTVLNYEKPPLLIVLIAYLFQQLLMIKSFVCMADCPQNLLILIKLIRFKGL